MRFEPNKNIFMEMDSSVNRGTIRATALIETITAAFEMEEILYEFKDHSLGLNCGRWDYLFSYCKRLKADPSKVTPDRQYLTMTSPFMYVVGGLFFDTGRFVSHKTRTIGLTGKPMSSR